MILEAIRKGLRMFRQSRTYRDHHVYRHYDRLNMDRQTAAMLLSCLGSTWCRDLSVDDLMFLWETQADIWSYEVMLHASRLFAIGDFVTYILCSQERRDGEKLRSLEYGEDITLLQHNQDEIMRDVERDLQLAGFLQYTN